MTLNNLYNFILYRVWNSGMVFVVLRYIMEVFELYTRFNHYFEEFQTILYNIQILFIHSKMWYTLNQHTTVTKRKLLNKSILFVIILRYISIMFKVSIMACAFFTFKKIYFLEKIIIIYFPILFHFCLPVHMFMLSGAFTSKHVFRMWMCRHS